jgi:hypothetical protein
VAWHFYDDLLRFAGFLIFLSFAFTLLDPVIVLLVLSLSPLPCGKGFFFFSREEDNLALPFSFSFPLHSHFLTDTVALAFERYTDEMVTKTEWKSHARQQRDRDNTTFTGAHTYPWRPWHGTLPANRQASLRTARGEAWHL